MEIHRLPNRVVKSVSLLVMAALPICVAAKDVRPMQFAGYKAVPVHYGPLNKMIISVNINGQPANLLIDTGANQTMLIADAAEAFGVTPSQHGLRYIGYTQINGQLFPIAFVRSLAAGSVNFGSASVALLTSNAGNTFANRGRGGGAPVDGALGTDILVRRQAVINCRTKLIFFKVDRSPVLQLASIASSEKFIKISLRREENGAFTVSGSIQGKNGRFLVDTGAFVTTFNEPVVKSLGIALRPTQTTARFTNRVTRELSIGQINDLTIGDFKVPPAKFGVAVLPNFAIREGNAQIDGILGMDLLFDCHAIIDFGSMNLFLK
jgi:predicted aspartyl protease